MVETGEQFVELIGVPCCLSDECEDLFCAILNGSARNSEPGSLRAAVAAWMLLLL